MGRVIAYGVDVPLKPNEFRLLVAMALTALDGDTPPRYFDSREASAVALGRRVPDALPADHPDFRLVDDERKAAFSAVRQAIDGLVKLEAIERLKAATNGRRAEFALRLDADDTQRTSEFGRRNGNDGRRKSLSPERRKSLSLQRRKSLHPGIENSYPLERGTTQEPTRGTDLGITPGHATTSPGPVDNENPRIISLRGAA